MDFRVIRKQVASRNLMGALRRSRYLGLGAALCAVLGTAGLAQSNLDFLDPLDDERVRVEESRDAPARSPAIRKKPERPVTATPEKQPAGLLNRARDGAKTGASAAQDQATGIWARIRAALSGIGDRLGLSATGLIALLGLLLAAIAALVGWTLFRGRSGTIATDSDLYARSRKAVRRRNPGDADPLATKAVPEFEEKMPEDFDSIFEEERVAAPVPPRTMDSSTWQKPNLDRLRDSIKADWKADKNDKVRSGIGSETLTPVTASALSAAVDPAKNKLDDISDGWEEWDDQVKPEDDPWGESLTTGNDTAASEDAAINRIRALRESLRAS